MSKVYSDAENVTATCDMRRQRRGILGGPNQPEMIRTIVDDLGRLARTRHALGASLLLHMPAIEGDPVGAGQGQPGHFPVLLPRLGVGEVSSIVEGNEVELGNHQPITE